MIKFGTAIAIGERVSKDATRVSCTSNCKKWCRRMALRKLVSRNGKIAHCPTEQPRKKILLVEGGEYTREFLKDFPIMEGFDVRTAGNGEEGLAVYDQFQPDLVVTDILMPEKSGLQLITEVRERYPIVKAIYVTACLYEPFLARELRRDVSQHPECQAMGKPFELEDMRNSIEKTLGQ